MTPFQKWCDHMWLYFNYFLGVVMSVALIVNWEVWDVPQKLVCLLAIVVPAHNFEEYMYPGGFFFMNNLGSFSKDPMLYPQNTITTTITNTGAEVLLVVLTLLTPQIGLPVVVAVAIFGFAETLIHVTYGIMMKNRYRSTGKKSIYAPGLFTCLVLFVQLSSFSVHWLIQQGPSASDIWLGIGIVAVIIIGFIAIPFGVAFRFHSEKYAMHDLGYFERYEKLLKAVPGDADMK